MARYYNLLGVDTPTDFSLTLQPGGSLAANTTYYYRLIAVRRENPYNNNYQLWAFSAPTEELSVTTDTTKRSVLIQWTPPANCYGVIIQRRTASVSYDPGVNSTLTLSDRITIFGVSSYTDGGVTLTSNPYFPDYAQPIVEVYSDNNDLITTTDILNYAISSGWQAVTPVMPVPSNTYVRSQTPIVIFGSLYVRDCQFRIVQPIIINNGTIHVMNSVAMDNTDYGYNPAIMLHIISLLSYYNGSSTSNVTMIWLFMPTNTLARAQFLNLNSASRLGNRTYYYGTNCYIDNTYFESCFFSSYVTPNQPSLAATFLNTNVQSHIGMGTNFSKIVSNSALPFGNTTYGIVHGAIASDCISFKADSMASLSNVFLNIEHYILFDHIHDAGNFYNMHIGIRPYSSISLGKTAQWYYTVNFKVSDKDDNPISGAKIYLKNSLGHSALFVDSGAIFTTGLNNTDDVSNWTVNDGSKFSVGDVVRQICATELMLVTNIAGNVLTVQRGYGGTLKRRASNTYVNRNVLKQVDYVTTDENGLASVIAAVFEIYCIRYATVSQLFGTIAQHKADGWLDTIEFWPFDLKIEAPGYATYEDKITVDKRLDLEIALSPPGGGGGVFLRIR